MRSGAVHQRLLYALLIVLAAACLRERVRDAPPQSTIAKLHGRCISLKRPVLLVSGSDEEITDSYLAPADNRVNSGAVLEAGDQLVVQQVVLKRAFEGRYAIIVGRSKKRYADRKISLFLLFHPEWKKRAE